MTQRQPFLKKMSFWIAAGMIFWLAQGVFAGDTGRTSPAVLLSPEYHVGMAQAYSLNGDVPHAIQEYELALALDPSSSLIQLRLASEYLKDQQGDRARRLLQEVVGSTPFPQQLSSEKKEAMLLLADLSLQADEKQEALKWYETVLKQDPWHQGALLGVSQILVWQGKTKKAIQRFQQLSKHPHSFEEASQKAFLFFLLGGLQTQEGSLPKATQSYQKALQLAPDFAQAQFALGSLYELQNESVKAIEIYQQMKNPFALQRLVDIYLNEKKFDQAIPYLEQLQALRPQHLGSKIQLGLAHRESKQYEAAIRIFKGILKQYPESDRTWFYLGVLYAETQQVEASIEAFRRIPVNSEFYPEAVLQGAYELKLLKKNEEARSWLASLVKEFQEQTSLSLSVAVYLFLASLEEELHPGLEGVNQAVAWLEQAKKDYPADEKLLYYLGSLYDRQGKSEFALETLQSILEMNPNHSEALNYVGYTLTVQKRDLEKAGLFLKRALELQPKNPYVLDSLGWYFFTKGNLTEALKYLLQALACWPPQQPAESVLLEHLGDVYLALGQWKKAKGQYQEALLAPEVTSQKKEELEKKLRQFQEVPSTVSEK